MLKKLFAHEWKACWRLMAAVNGIVLIMTLIGIVVFHNDFWSTIEMETVGNSMATVALVLYFLLYMISVGSLGFVVSLYFYVRFYNNLYTDQGYLMHTLPVTSGQLIWSKAFVGVLWHFISVIVIMISVAAVSFSIISGTGGFNFDELWITLINGLGITDYFMRALYLGVFLLIMVASCFMTIFLGYTAVSIGQLFKKQKILGAIGAYCIIYLIGQFISSMATVPLTKWVDSISIQGEVSNVFGLAIMFVVFIVICLVTAGLYFVNEHIMKYKLNLE